MRIQTLFCKFVVPHSVCYTTLEISEDHGWDQICKLVVSDGLSGNFLKILPSDSGVYQGEEYLLTTLMAASCRSETAPPGLGNLTAPLPSMASLFNQASNIFPALAI